MLSGSWFINGDSLCHPVTRASCHLYHSLIILELHWSEIAAQCRAVDPLSVGAWLQRGTRRWAHCCEGQTTGTPGTTWEPSRLPSWREESDGGFSCWYKQAALGGLHGNNCTERTLMNLISTVYHISSHVFTSKAIKLWEVHAGVRLWYLFHKLMVF